MRRRNLYLAGTILLAFVLLTLVFGLASCQPPTNHFEQAIKIAEDCTATLQTWRGVAAKWEVIAIENGRQRDEALKLLSECTRGERP